MRAGLPRSGAVGLELAFVERVRVVRRHQSLTPELGHAFCPCFWAAVYRGSTVDPRTDEKNI